MHINTHRHVHTHIHTRTHIHTHTENKVSGTVHVCEFQTVCAFDCVVKKSTPTITKTDIPIPSTYSSPGDRHRMYLNVTTSNSASNQYFLKPGGQAQVVSD
jgi:hypothetical protein